MPPSENFLKILTDQFGDFRDSQLQIEEMLRENERKSGEGVLSDTAGNTKGGSITVPLTSCLTGLD